MLWISKLLPAQVSKNLKACPSGGVPLGLDLELQLGFGLMRSHRKRRNQESDEKVKVDVLRDLYSMMFDCRLKNVVDRSISCT